MKLQFLKPVFERFESDFSTESGKRLSDQHFELAFNMIKDHEMDISEIRSLARELEQNEMWDRTDNSAAFVLSRLHVLVHGVAPYGITENSAEKMFDPSGPMVRFAETKGIDAGDNIRRARIEMRGRKAKVTQAEAAKALQDFYLANKNSLPRNVLIANKENIIRDIMAGLQPEEAINRYIRH